MTVEHIPTRRTAYTAYNTQVNAKLSVLIYRTEKQSIAYRTDHIRNCYL